MTACSITLIVNRRVHLILEEIITRLEKRFFSNRWNLIDFKTEIIIFFTGNDKRLQNSETIAVSSSENEMLNQFKYLGDTIDIHLDFLTKTKSEEKCCGIETIGTTQHKFLTTVLFVLFQASVWLISNILFFSAEKNLTFFKIFLKKQMNWALMSFYFSSCVKGSIDLRKHKILLCNRQHMELKWLTFFGIKKNTEESTICFFFRLIFLLPFLLENELTAFKHLNYLIKMSRLRK